MPKWGSRWKWNYHHLGVYAWSLILPWRHLAHLDAISLETRPLFCIRVQKRHYVDPVIYHIIHWTGVCLTRYIIQRISICHSSDGCAYHYFASPEEIKEDTREINYNRLNPAPGFSSRETHIRAIEVRVGISILKMLFLQLIWSSLLLWAGHFPFAQPLLSNEISFSLKFLNVVTVNSYRSISSHLVINGGRTVTHTTEISFFSCLAVED